MLNILKKSMQRDPISKYVNADKHLIKNLTAFDLTLLGVGTVVGAGIFILPGHEAFNHAGPAVAVAFLFAAILSGISGMSFAEFSSVMPVAGSAYTFGNVIYGKLIGWILGWSLIAEYFLAVPAVATGFSSYFVDLLKIFNIHVPTAIQVGPAEGGVVNIIAMLIILISALIIARGARTSKKVENAMVILQVTIIILFIICGLFFINPHNYQPFYPKQFHTGLFGLGGIFSATASVFFAFLGFDALASTAAEVKNPKRNMPRGILFTVGIVAVLYVAFSVVMTGVANYKLLGVDSPAAKALEIVHMPQLSAIITSGALIGMFTTIFAMLLASSRLAYSFGRDGLLPTFLAKLTGGNHVPLNALLVAGLVESVLAGFVPLSTLAGLINAGTLLAFTFINFGVILLRHRKDISTEGGFKVPLYPIIPLVGAISSFFFFTQLPKETLELFVVWFIIGILWYFIYGIRHEK